MQFDFRQEILDFYSEELETGYKLFFNAPQKSELEILELQMSVGNNLCYIESIQDPSTVFWYLISYLKHMNFSLIHKNGQPVFA